MPKSSDPCRKECCWNPHGVCRTRRDCQHHRAYDFQAQIEDETASLREELDAWNVQATRAKVIR